MLSLTHSQKKFLVKRKLLPRKSPMNNHFLKLHLFTKTKPQPKNPLKSATLRLRTLKRQAHQQYNLVGPSSAKPLLGKKPVPVCLSEASSQTPCHATVIRPQCDCGSVATSSVPWLPESLSAFYEDYNPNVSSRSPKASHLSIFSFSTLSLLMPKQTPASHSSLLQAPTTKGDRVLAASGL